MGGEAGVSRSKKSSKSAIAAENEAGSAILGPGHRNDRMRVRAAWMYFVEQMTQNDIADVLGVGRVTVVRLLSEARGRNEVKIAIEGDLSELVRLERELEARFNVQEAIVAPVSDPKSDPIPPISAAAGAFLSDAMKPGMTVGVGWGRTLFACLSSIGGRSLPDFKVISLLGGVSQARKFNPAEFAWRFAQVFQGDGYLIPAPAVVDSPSTKEALIKRCGIQEIFDMADSLDAVIVSVGGIDSATTFYRGGFLTEEQRQALVDRGAVGDLLFHFFDKDGEVLDHPVNDRVMSVDIDRIRRAPLRILASGGQEKVAAMKAAMKLVMPTVLITDEFTARAMLQT